MEAGIFFQTLSKYLNLYKQVESFFERYPEAGAGARARENAIQSIKENIVWIADYEAEIADWLVMQLSTM